MLERSVKMKWYIRTRILVHTNSSKPGKRWGSFGFFLLFFALMSSPILRLWISFSFALAGCFYLFLCPSSLSCLLFSFFISLEFPLSMLLRVEKKRLSIRARGSSSTTIRRPNLPRMTNELFRCSHLYPSRAVLSFVSIDVRTRDRLHKRLSSLPHPLSHFPDPLYFSTRFSLFFYHTLAQAYCARL